MPSVPDTAYPRLKNHPTQKDLLILYTPTTKKAHKAMLEALKMAVEAKYDLVDLLNIA